jgi:hypothetical protein
VWIEIGNCDCESAIADFDRQLRISVDNCGFRSPIANHSAIANFNRQLPISIANCQSTISIANQQSQNPQSSVSNPQSIT